MSRRLIISVLLGMCLPGVAARPCSAWDFSEHRMLGDTVYFEIQSIDSTLLDPDLLQGVGAAQQNTNQSLQPQGKSFGQLCAFYAADDHSRDRFHDRGRTILDQLRTLDSSEIAATVGESMASWTAASAQSSSSAQFKTPHIKAENAVTAYLLHHLLALRFVGRPQGATGDPHERLRQALILESMAQGYLADAFSAGHILVPLDDPFSSLHPRNNRETHNHYCTEGVYVINSRGDVWQTFGDRLLRWYGHSFSAVIEACEYSLSEVMVTYHLTTGIPLPDGLRSWLSEVAPEAGADELVASWLSVRDGADYYELLHMPTLKLIPMPVAASWSIRTETIDEHGIRQRHHYPQLGDDGLHDPDDGGMDTEFLYARSSVPDWLIPVPLHAASSADPSGLIRSNPDWASVHWMQSRSVAPSFKGALLRLGGRLLLADDSPKLTETFGIGYGFFDDLILLRNVSADLSVGGISRESDPWVVTLSVGGGLTFSAIPGIRALHLEGGPALVGNSGSTSIRGMLAVGVDSGVLRLGFTNAGITVRAKYVSLLGDHDMSGPALEFIVH